MEVPDGSAILRGWTEEPNGGPDRGAKQGARRGQTGPDGARRSQTGLDGGPNGARRGGGRKDYLLLKEKTTCSVYMSCKSSSTSDVSEVGWL
jgi:hypothetical protein